ncbi:MAG: FAD:protein FMN transferase [Oscillospiraceae bacterium]|nr:FAD:protein FMN transferase [Oscillospiraceae bacterium]
MRVKYPQRFGISALIFILLFTNLSACANQDTEKITKSDFVLNTIASITLYGNYDEALIDECFDLCRHYESLFSRTNKNSEIYRLNHREISSVSDETAELIEEGLRYSELSNGAFDITVEPLSSLWNFTSDTPSVPNVADIEAACGKVDYTAVKISGNTVTFSNDYAAIDLGAIAKGYIADRVKQLLVSRGVERAIINLGGNVLCIGGKSKSEGFKIGIQYPFGEGSIASVTVSGLSVVTSGVYERYFRQDGILYHHILNPKSGYPYDNGLLSVTIIGESSGVCDALSTTCFALGKDAGMALVESMNGYYAVFITDDYRLWYTEGAETALDFET